MTSLTLLSGIKVIDCSSRFDGIRATGILADYGAEVTWVEPPGGYTFREREPAATSVFCRGKRSTRLDLDSEA
jgi:crotonobetainyl-CoA:carnitine CoA-transferase CaiB-like acyl-CoA transferase